MEIPEWFEEEDLDGLEPSLRPYLALFTFIFVVGFVFYVHRLKPIEHAILVSTPNTANVEISLSKDFILKWGAIRDGLGSRLESLDYLTDLDARLTEHAFEIEFGVARAFSGGRAELQPEAEEDISKLVQAIYPNLTNERVEIRGYTDDTPIVKNRNIYPTNIELSAVRASAFVRHFVDAGLPAERIQPTGFGATYPKYPNRDDQGEPIKSSQAKNRRLVVRILEVK